jgi:hypothetical protein
MPEALPRTRTLRWWAYAAAGLGVLVLRGRRSSERIAATCRVRFTRDRFSEKITHVVR